MYKNFKKIFASIFLILVLANPNVFAFHQNGTSSISIDKNEGDKKKDYQTGYCTADVDERKIPIKDKSENEEEQSNKKVEKKSIFEINSYHSNKFQNAPDTLNFSILKNIKKMPYVNSQYSVEQLLAYYCVQEKPQEGKSKVFKISQNSPTAKLYDQIAVINGRENRKSEIGEDIFEIGVISLAVKDTKLIYSKAQLIIDEEIRIKIAEEKKAEANKKVQEEKNWIAENKQPLLDKIDKKIFGFDDQISKLNNDYKQLKIDYENFEVYFKEKIIEVEDLLEDVDRSKDELKEKAKQLRSKKRQFLSNTILEDFESKFKKTNKVAPRNFPNTYEKLEKLRKDVAKGKKKRQFTKKNKGFFDRWEILETSKLNIKQQDKIDALSGEIKEARFNIVNNIDNLVSEINNLEEEFGSRLPWNLIIIGIIVFLVISGVGAYVYLNNRRIQKLQEEADKKVGSLKSDLEGKLKDTSEQIKSVGRAAAKSGQTGTSQQDQVVEEKPKSQEEIIAAKYDELVSDYREALDDFAKVAKFKQKWNGLALSRKERQDGSKTILISSPRAFEKADIWCVTFSDKYFAFAGSTVRSNMATYMNLDFERASREFKGVFSISTGTNYTCEPSVLRKGGAGFVVERAGKIVFPT